jgi:hypothetical protein
MQTYLRLGSFSAEHIQTLAGRIRKQQYFVDFRVLKYSLEQFRNSNVALLLSYPCAKVVIVEQLGRTTVLPRRRDTLAQLLMEGSIRQLKTTKIHSIQTSA